MMLATRGIPSRIGLEAQREAILGFEAQSAAAFRLLRLGAGITKSADQIVPPIPPADIAPAPVAAAPKRRHAAKKVHKKSAPVGQRSKRAKGR